MKKFYKIFVACILAVIISIGIQNVSTVQTDAASVVATIGKKKYSSLQKAIKAAGNNKTIKLKKNVDLKKGLTINKKKKAITIDLNGHHLSVGAENSNGKGVTIKAGTITFKNSKKKGYFSFRSCLISQGAKVICKKAKYYDGTSGSLFENRGVLEIKAGIYSPSSLVVDNYNVTKISGGTIKGTLRQTTGTLNISGGTMKSGKYLMFGVLCIGGGTTNISGGTILGNSEPAIASGFSTSSGSEVASLNISGGVFSANGSPAVSLEYSDVNVQISGGTFRSDQKSLYVFNFCDTVNINITGGVFRAPVEINTFDGNIIYRAPARFDKGITVKKEV